MAGNVALGQQRFQRKHTGVGLLVMLVLTGCSKPTPPINKIAGFAQGTTYHISFWSEQAIDQRVITAEVEQEFATIDKLLSNYRPDSTIETFNAAENTDSQAVGPEIVGLVKIAAQVSEASQGCYDLTVKPLFDLWGFKKDQLNIPDTATIAQTLKQIGMSKLQIVDDSHLRKQAADLKVDLSSIAQGYSVERISQVLGHHGIKHYLVEIGGELKTLGVKPDQSAWRIAVERPAPGKVSIQKIITLPKDSAAAVMTSGTYRHYFDANGQRYSHILDARLGKPVLHNVVSVTVIHPDPTLADAWSTALLCLGLTDGLKAADAAQIPALFITQTDQQLTETKSQSLIAAKAIDIH